MAASDISLEAATFFVVASLRFIRSLRDKTAAELSSWLLLSDAPVAAGSAHQLQIRSGKMDQRSPDKVTIVINGS